jgi:hypothetical protein
LNTLFEDKSRSFFGLSDKFFDNVAPSFSGGPCYPDFPDGLCQSTGFWGVRPAAQTEEAFAGMILTLQTSDVWEQALWQKHLYFLQKNGSATTLDMDGADAYSNLGVFIDHIQSLRSVTMSVVHLGYVIANQKPDFFKCAQMWLYLGKHIPCSSF